VNSESRIENLVRLVRDRALNLYEVHRLCCSEAVILVMNQGFSGGLDPELAVRLGSGFCGGMGGAGCTCGGLSGAILVLGLFLGPGTDGWPGKRRFRELTKRLHDEFARKGGSTCCRDLIKKFANDRRGRAKNCGNLTALGAELACRIVLEARPELSEECNLDFLSGRDSRLSVVLRKLMGRKSYLG